MKFIALCYSCILICTHTWCQYAPLAVSRDSVNFLSKEKLLADLDAYADGIAHKHIQPFTHIKKRAFFDEIENIKATAASYDVDELLIQLLKVNAMIQDEHTRVVYCARDIFPFACYWFEEGLVITRTETDQLSLLFSRVIAVNGRPIADVIEKIGTLDPTKNDAGLRTITQRSLFDPVIMHGLQVAPSRAAVEYTLVTMKNDTVKIRPEARDWKKIKLSTGFDNKVFLKNTKSGNYWYKYVDTGNYIYFKYAHCLDENKEHLFVDFAKTLVAEIEERHPAKIIIDMRDNGGGYPTILRPFINTLSRSALNKKGKIAVLIGRRTFSSAIINSAELRAQTYATRIGEGTSGDVVFYAGVRYFKLPNTALMISYSTQYWATDEKYEGSLRPDIVIPETFADYSRGIDAALLYAITH